MYNHITTYTIAAITFGVVGLLTFSTSDNASNSVSAQAEAFQLNATGMYCQPNDYMCHDRLGKQQYDAQNHSQAMYHYGLAAENAIAYPEVAKHYEQLYSALKYGNNTDAEDHYNQAHSYLDMILGK
jgi:hypothetical protein